MEHNTIIRSVVAKMARPWKILTRMLDRLTLPGQRQHICSTIYCFELVGHHSTYLTLEGEVQICFSSKKNSTVGTIKIPQKARFLVTCISGYDGWHVIEPCSSLS